MLRNPSCRRRSGAVRLAVALFCLSSSFAGAGNPADLNGDGLANADDLSRLLFGLLTSLSPAPAGDFSDDGVLDSADVNRMILLGTRTQSTWTPGTETILVEQTVGFAGGVVAGPAGTPLEGVTVDFTVGALRQDSTIRLGYDSGTLTPAVGRTTRQPIVLHVNDNPYTIFDEAVNITIPITAPAGQAAGSGIEVPYYLLPNGDLEPMTIIDIDRTAGTVTFETFHASTMGSVWDPLTNCDDYQAVALSSYGTVTDGFQIENKGSTINAAGECFGMTAFSAWYERKYPDGPDFFPRFMNIIGTTNLTGQDIIATRAYTSISRLWNFYSRITTRQARLSHMEQFSVIRNVLQNSGDTVLIYIADSQAHPTAAHSILAYGIFQDACDGTVRCYDPNFPGEPQNIRLSDGDWVPYAPGGFNFRRVNYSGHGSLRLTERYEHILEDAEQNFQGSNKATILNLFPANNSEHQVRTVTVSGKIESGEVLISALRIHVNSTYFDAAIPPTGEFSVPVSLDIGRNNLTFETWGEDEDNNIRVVPNTMDGQQYVLQCQDDSAAILVTLTWNTGDTDLDLYVYDPTGAVSWFGSNTTPDGGELDFDDRSGYGPEHWTLTYTDTVRFNEAYRVRVHYYSDHQPAEAPTISTGFFVVMQLHENQSNEYTTHAGGGISVDDSGSAGPTGSGPAWRDVADIIPVQAARGGPVEWVVLPLSGFEAEMPHVAPEHRKEAPPKPDWTLE